MIVSYSNQHYFQFQLLVQKGIESFRNKNFRMIVTVLSTVGILLNITFASPIVETEHDRKYGMDYNILLHKSL
jgi:hypothetical protein